jgi:UPF0755 protein
MKKILVALTSFLLMAIILAGLGAFYVMQGAASPGPLTESKILLIKRGTGTAAIASQLQSEGVIESDLIFKINAAFEKSKGSLKAGEYEFTPHISIKEIITMVREGRVYDRKITFREGLTSYQIVGLLNAATDFTGESVINIPAEGSLLPETYHYTGADTRQKILDQMSSAMKKTIEELWPNRSGDLPIKTIEEAIVLASIVEKETGVADERKKVAGVFINRLRRGMPLQSDPTVIYGMTNGALQDEGQGPIGRRLLTKDLQEHTAYNTYMNAGLPPGPIANPGRASIEAVLHPEIHDFIYFVADGTGGHAFGRTLTEHNANVAKWRKIRREQSR